MWHHYRRKINKWGHVMAIDTSKGNPNMDYAEHVATYRGFIKLAQYGTAICVLLMVAMFFFLVPASN